MAPTRRTATICIKQEVTSVKPYKYECRYIRGVIRLPKYRKLLFILLRTRTLSLYVPRGSVIDERPRLVRQVEKRWLERSASILEPKKPFISNNNACHRG